VSALRSRGAANANVSSWKSWLRVSRYNEKVDGIDHSLFATSTQAFFDATEYRIRVSNTPRRLSITLAEKRGLLRQLQLEFGAELDDDQQTYLVNAATVIRDAVRLIRLR